MHDPLTQAFQIKYPWKDKPTQFSPQGYRHPFITIWHKDPEKDGSDDSCGWFKRARHGDQEILKKIEMSFEFEWDASYGGWFRTDGTPILSTAAITLDMFRRAARAHFDNWEKTDRFMRRHFYDIFQFAENPTDSMHPFITGRYGIHPRNDRIGEAASIIYGCILRWSQSWYKHPRWHFWHWRLQVHPWQHLRRRFWDRCCKCGKRGFPKGVSAIGDWSGTRTWHSTCDESGGIAMAEAKS